MRSEAFTKILTTNKAFAALIFFICFTLQHFQAQAKQRPEYQVKAAFLYNFTQFIDWPSTVFNSPAAPFIIGILGENPFGTYIEDLVEGERTGDHPIIVKYYKDVSETLDCHVLFINIKETLQIKQALTALTNRSILTVSDANSFARLGGMIRFYKEANKIKLEINIESIKSSQISVSSKLLSVSRIFDPRGK